MPLFRRKVLGLIWTGEPVAGVCLAEVAAAGQVVLGADGPLEQFGGEGELDGRVVGISVMVDEFGRIGGEVVQLPVAFGVEEQLPVAPADHLEVAALGDGFELVEGGAFIGKVERGTFGGGVVETADSEFSIDAAELGGREWFTSDDGPETAPLDALGEGEPEHLAEGGIEIDKGDELVALNR